MRSTKQRLQGCKSRNTVVSESFTFERKTVLSLCRRCEDEVREGGEEKEEKEVEVDVVDGEGSGCRGATIQGAGSRRRRRRMRGKRVVIQDLSRSL